MANAGERNASMFLAGGDEVATRRETVSGDREC